MKVDTLPAVICALAFLLPGFVWSAVYAALIPRKPDTEQIRFMQFFALSSLNFALWSPIILLIYQKRLLERHMYYSALLSCVIVLLFPMFAGWLTAHLRRRRSIALFLNWMGFRTVLHNTTAWDFKLSETGPVWVNVLLKNGDVVFGLFGAASFAGDSGPTGDLYLEKTLVFGEEKSPDEKYSNQGIWIACDQIATIEFVGE